MGKMRCGSLRIPVLLLLIAFSSSCQLGLRQIPSLPAGFQPPTERQKTDWAKKQRLSPATSKEIARAKKSEVPFVNGRATSQDGKVRVVFHMGKIQNAPDRKNTSTSFYAINDAGTGRDLAKVESSVTEALAKECGYRQFVWFAPDGRYILIWDEWYEGCGPHITTALLSAGSDGRWTVRFLELPEFTGYEGIPDHGPKPVGLDGDMLLFNPMLSDKIYKKPFRSLPDAPPPLPFAIG